MGLNSTMLGNVGNLPVLVEGGGLRHWVMKCWACGLGRSYGRNLKSKNPQFENDNPDAQHRARCREKVDFYAGDLSLRRVQNSASF